MCSLCVRIDKSLHVNKSLNKSVQHVFSYRFSSQDLDETAENGYGFVHMELFYDAFITRLELLSFSYLDFQ